jgi:hypothetical protein
MARVRVAGNKVMIGLIGGARGTGRSVARAVIDTMVVGARVDLVGVAHGGMDHQVDPVGLRFITCRSHIPSFLGAHLANGQPLYILQLLS